MALSITNPTLSTTYDSTEVDANFADIVSKCNANIGTADMSATAGITAAQMAVSYQEVWLTLTFDAGMYGAVWPAAAADGANPAKDEVLDSVPLPGSDADTAWTITDISHDCNDTGTAAASYDIRTGAHAVGGGIAGAGTVITGEAITANGIDVGANERALEGGAVTITQSATVRLLYLVCAAQGTAVMDDTGGGGSAASRLTVTIALRRQIQA